jgi:S1-C subfamily serine protease
MCAGSRLLHSVGEETKSMQSTWQQLSKDISDGVAHTGQVVVAVDGRNGHTSSGIVWRDSLVLTAAHSIRTDSPTLVLQDGKAIQAQLIGRDPGTDIAVLKSKEDLGNAAAKFGSTDSLRIGDLVVAVARTRRGNVVGSSGILSGLMGEFRAGRAKIDQFIRPDLMLYPGFSGGALIDATGKILGMNTSGLLRGKSLTIPSTTLTRVAEELTSRGHIARPYIGLVMQPVPIPDALQKRSGIDSRAGLLVMHVEPQGPADAAGAILGDVLLELDGNRFEDLEPVQDVLSRKGAGQEVKAVVLRGGQRVDLNIRIGQRPVG